MTLLRRSLECEVRAIDEEKREAEFVAATEGGVRTHRGTEVLRMSGVRLDRYRRNPVVLDSHRMESARDVVGVADVQVDKDGRRLLARVCFDDDAHSRLVFGKIRSGSLRGLSIGYTVDRRQVRELGEGETDGEGDALVTGPAAVVRSWELHEISVVPVPADADALRRSFYEEGQVADSEQPHAGGVQKAPAPVINLEAERLKRETEVTEARTAARLARHGEIRSLCPEALRSYLDGLLLEDPDLTTESARRALLEERKRASAPVGTSEPVPVQPIKSQPAASAAPTINWDERLAPLCG